MLTARPASAAQVVDVMSITTMVCVLLVPYNGLTDNNERSRASWSAGLRAVAFPLLLHRTAHHLKRVIRE
jgi:hypothetical protein